MKRDVPRYEEGYHHSELDQSDDANTKVTFIPAVQTNEVANYHRQMPWRASTLTVLMFSHRKKLPEEQEMLQSKFRWPQHRRQ
jgi:hypothetical protein